MLKLALLALLVARVACHLDDKRILCPVLASMYNGGDLHTNENGSTTITEMFNGLTLGIGCGDALATGQTYGIMDYDKDNKESQHSRNRCVPGFTASGTLCAAERAVGHYTEDNERWLNIFKLNGLQAVEHGMSTGTRGGANNVPDLDTCNGVFPCEDRFHRFYVKNADSRGRIYHKNILKVICQARKEGDRSGEYSYASGVVPVPGLTLPGGAPAREWQMKAALSGWLQAFGRTDEDGELFLTVDDARAMFMEGRYPDGWQKRPWGCLLTKCTGTSSFAKMSFLDVINQDVPCDVGENDEWWQDSNCHVSTGATCTISCDGGATCVNGQCMCARGKNGLGMCAKDGVCVERANDCTYFGEKCSPPMLADNPSAIGNYADVTVTV